jgi:hypothetical protein
VLRIRHRTHHIESTKSGGRQPGNRDIRSRSHQMSRLGALGECLASLERLKPTDDLRELATQRMFDPRLQMPGDIEELLKISGPDSERLLHPRLAFDFLSCLNRAAFAAVRPDQTMDYADLGARLSVMMVDSQERWLVVVSRTRDVCRLTAIGRLSGRKLVINADLEHRNEHTARIWSYDNAMRRDRDERGGSGGPMSLCRPFHTRVVTVALPCYP